jgi:hypothetical protein
VQIYRKPKVKSFSQNDCETGFYKCRNNNNIHRRCKACKRSIVAQIMLGSFWLRETKTVNMKEAIRHWRVCREEAG